MTKQVIVLRKDLNMRKGKMVAQGAHASMAVFFDRMKLQDNYDKDLQIYVMTVSQYMAEWMEERFTKICVSVNSERELLDIYQKAKEAGVACSLIKDAGLTEFGGVPTFTAVAVGPDLNEKIDPITGGLPLL